MKFVAFISYFRRISEECFKVDSTKQCRFLVDIPVLSNTRTKMTLTAPQHRIV